MAREMKDSGVAWIGKIPVGWNVRKIKHVANFFNGDRGKNYPSGADLVDDGVIFLTSNNIRGIQLDCSPDISKFITEERYSLLGGAKIQKGDIIYCLRGSVGNCAINKSVEKGTVASSLVDIRPTDVNSDFLNFYLQSPANSIQTSAYMNGTCAANLSAENVANYYFVQPPIPEQNVIANFLNSKCAEIDAVLEKTRTSIEEYKKLKQAIITQAVTKGVRGDRPMKESGIEWVPMIPADWSSYRGKHLFYETNERSETGSEELLTVSHKTGITPRSQKNVNMFMSESLIGYKICREGDIAANTMWMWQGAIGVSAYYGVISPSYNTYRQRNGAFDPQYLDYLLRIQPLVEQYNVCSTGITASRLRLYPEQFLSIKFVVPPMEEQQEIVKFLHSRADEMDTIIQKKEQFMTELENYKKSLIYEYVTGKKGV